jgi:hypothetical protein
MGEERKKVGVWPSIAALLIGLPVLYVASFGPACWLTAQPWQNGVRNDGWDMPPRWMAIYWPFGIILKKGDSSIKTAVNWWATIGIKRTSNALVPFGFGRHDRAAAFPPNAELQ